MRRKNQQSAESVNAVQVHPLSDAMHSELLINTSGIVILFDFVAYSPSLKYPKKKPEVKKILFSGEKLKVSPEECLVIDTVHQV